MLCEKAISSKTSVQPLQPSRRGQIPIAQAAPPGAEPTAISCLGAFRTPAASARGEPVIAGVRKPAQYRTLAGPLLDHPVGAKQERLGKGEADRLGGLGRWRS